MKWLVREQLAPWLRVTVLSKTPTSSPVSSRQDNNDAGDFQQDGPQLEDVTSGTTDKLMLEIRRELLLMRLGSKAGDADREKRNDWKLPAAVVDRTLCIIFSILVVGGTIIFLVTFAAAYND